MNKTIGWSTWETIGITIINPIIIKLTIDHNNKTFRVYF